jgi:hypothetical protein
VPRPVDFVRDIEPIFREHCLACHGPQKQKGQLRLDSKASAFQGGTSGRIILPGKGQESRLVSILLEPAEEDRMPQKSAALPKETIGLVRVWIDEGAAWPDSASAGPAVPRHWAYEKPARRPLPAPAMTAWIRTPVDAFLAAALEEHHLKPRPEAPRHVLLRRLYLDLIGLPPTPEELAAFLSDPSPGAYEAVVDRLLEDPRYGERWGRHWMDVWRYSDWAGYQQEIRESARHVWRWREWIIESMNRDKPYDRMILEMIAGDELAPGDPETLRATGFLARNWQKFSRDAWLQNVVEHTSKAFLATTLNCARCHSHFFDPISQTEYYQFRAFFEPYQVRTDPLPGQPNLELDGLSRIYDGDPQAPTYFYVRGNEKNPDKSKSLSPAVPRALGGSPLKIEPVALPRGEICPEKRPYVQRDLLAAAQKEADQARAKVDESQQAIDRLEGILAASGKTPEERAKAQTALQAELEALPLGLLSVPLHEAKRASLEASEKAQELEDAGDRATDVFRAAAESAWVAERRLQILESKRGQFLARRAVAKAQAEAKKPEEIAALRKKLDEAERALAQAEAKARLAPSTDFARRKVTVYPAQSSGRRLALARWIASPENPLTARVAVNQIWMRHFGKPLVPTVFEFGKHGRAPSHPALLDWLATELVRLGWSQKRLHRLLVTSTAYRMDSVPDPASLALDPENRWLWRMNPRRMESEVVRDSVLYVAGKLDLSRGGPEIAFNQGLAVPRRSLYFQHAAEKQVEFLLLFDAANVTECYERTESVVPQQALAMANSTLVLDQSRRLAGALSRESEDGAAFLTRAFVRILGRLPTPEERAECRSFLATQAELLRDPSHLKACPGGGGSETAPSTDPAQRAREDLVQVLFNHNDFVTIR